MNKKIEKFLILACVFQVLELVISYAFPYLLDLLMSQSGANPGRYIYTTWIYLVASIPLRVVAGLWLRSEADRLRVSPGVWFWTGFIFEIFGILLFYAYMILWKKIGAMPAKPANAP